MPGGGNIKPQIDTIGLRCATLDRQGSPHAILRDMSSLESRSQPVFVFALRRCGRGNETAAVRSAHGSDTKIRQFLRRSFFTVNSKQNFVSVLIRLLKVVIAGRRQYRCQVSTSTKQAPTSCASVAKNSRMILINDDNLVAEYFRIFPSY